MSTRARPVLAFTDLDRCRADADQRGDCMTLDGHGLLWSAPIELTLRDVVAAMLDQLDAMGLRPFQPAPQSPDLRCHRFRQPPGRPVPILRSAPES